MTVYIGIGTDNEVMSITTNFESAKAHSLVKIEEWTTPTGDNTCGDYINTYHCKSGEWKY